MTQSDQSSKVQVAFDVAAALAFVALVTKIAAGDRPGRGAEYELGYMHACRDIVSAIRKGEDG